MSLNASTVIVKRNRKEIPHLAAGTYPARLAQVIELGLHPDSFEGEEKSPKIKMKLTYELVDTFLTDEEGQDMPDKPRWISEDVWLFSLGAEKAKSTLRYKAFDPQGVHGGDFVGCLDTPVNVSVVEDPGKGKNKGKTFNKIAGVSAMRPKDAEKCPPLVNKSKFFLLDNPDIELFMTFPDYIKNVIKSNLEYAGSPLEKALAGVKEAAPEKQTDKQATKAADLSEELDDSNPY
jgi:hypothetical protein